MTSEFKRHVKHEALSRRGTLAGCGDGLGEGDAFKLKYLQKNAHVALAVKIKLINLNLSGAMSQRCFDRGHLIVAWTKRHGKAKKNSFFKLNYGCSPAPGCVQSTNEFCSFKQLRATPGFREGSEIVIIHFHTHTCIYSCIVALPVFVDLS